jgi:hypothetical protein
MIYVHADTAPYRRALDELALLAKGISRPARRHIFQLLDGRPDELFINLISRSTVIADDVNVVVVAQPSERFLCLLEALRTRHPDLELLDRLFVHENSLLA